MRRQGQNQNQGQNQSMNFQPRGGFNGNSGFQQRPQYRQNFQPNYRFNGGNQNQGYSTPPRNFDGNGRRMFNGNNETFSGISQTSSPRAFGNDSASNVNNGSGNLSGAPSQ